HPFIKVFEEERELTVMLLVDLSGSLVFGSLEKTKQQIAAELSAILAFSAMKNNDKVGLILFSDRIEKFVPPRKGKKHVLRIIRELLSFEPEGKETNIKKALEYLNNTIKKRSIVFLISDFFDSGYEKILRIVGKKHDFVGIVLQDEREKSLPKVGIVKLQDAETGSIRYLDTDNLQLQKWFAQTRAEQIRQRKSLFIKSRLDSIEVQTSQSYIKPLIDFFRLRERRW
ncbi:MAG: DUF58 domain-containing protein, partial [Bacillota bacterium]